MKHVLLFKTLLLLGSFACAQNSFFHESYDWEKEPKVHQPLESEKSAELVIIADKKFHEVAYDNQGQAYIYETLHYIYHVNSIKAVDAVNKGYMPLHNTILQVKLKARCVTADNKVINFNEATVKSVDNLEGAGPYKIFAVDGVEPGCDVEIIYTNKKKFVPYAYVYAQNRYPTRHYENRIISPKNLVFDTKSYNGLPEFRSDTSVKEKNHLILEQKDVPATSAKKYAADKANYRAFLFQLAFNTDKKNSRIWTWDVISREFYTTYYVFEKAETKAIEKVLKTTKISKHDNALAKVNALDTWLKNEVELSENYSESDFVKSTENKKMSELNAVRFYVGALKQMEIPFELVLGCDRTDIRFDPKFASYVYTKDFLIFFPGLDLYVSPVNVYSRPGFPNPYNMSSEGLFIKELLLGETATSTAKTKLIPASDYKDSYHNLELKAALDFNESSVKLNVRQILHGYSAYYIQPVYRYLTEEQKKEIHENYYLSENSEGVKDLKVENTGEEELFKKPFTVSYTADQNDFLENAGNKFLFKVGLLIGPQSELYEEEKRTIPGHITYTHYFKRDIEINIPEGYRITNAEDLKTEKICKLDGKDVATFRSGYEIKGNKLVLTVYEDYQAIEYPLEIYPAFKDVINAAADFNKKKLIFEKI